MENDRRFHILGDRFGREAADLVERLPAQYTTASAKKRRVPAVLPRLKKREENAVFFPEASPLFIHDVSERVGVVEVLGRLDEGHFGVFEVAEEPVQDIGEGHMVGVELENELPLRDTEGVV